MPRRWYRLRTRSYPSHVQRVPQAGGSRPHPCVGPASFVAPPSDAPRDAHRGRRGVVNGGCGGGVLARLDFFRYGGDMGQALVAPSVCALVGMLLRGAPRSRPAHVQAWRGCWMPSCCAGEQARFCG